MLDEEIHQRFTHALGYVARELRGYFRERDIEIVPSVSNHQIRSAPYLIKVDFLVDMLKKKNCAANVADNLIHHMRKHQNDPKRVFIFRPELPEGVVVAEYGECDGLVMRGVCEYFVPTDGLICRFDIIYC